MKNQRARSSPRLLALAICAAAWAGGQPRSGAPRRVRQASRPCPWPLAWLVALLLALQPLAAVAAPPVLMLDDARPYVEAWDAITVLHDHDGTLVADAMLRAPERFAMPQSAYATLGAQDGASWLRVPVMAAAGSDGAWVLKIDFGMLTHVELYLARDGRIVDRRSAGSGQSARGSLGGPVPAFIMHLEPGVRYDVLLRVETVSTKVLPISFEKPSTFHLAAMNEQLLQGTLNGLTLCLLLYSLAHWIMLRDHLFGKYALLVAGLFFYNCAWSGYGRQYLWGGSTWATLHLPGVISLLTACSAYLFVEHALARPGADRMFSRLMKGCALLCLATTLVWCFDLIENKVLVVFITSLGILPMLLGLPGAFRRAREKDIVGIYFLVGWTVSFICTALTAQTCTGRLPANYWTMHLLQFGSTFDMLAFMGILTLRSQTIRNAMLRAEAATRMKSEFLANMSHEIRTPITSIVGVSRLALAADPDPALRKHLDKILGVGEHLLGIVNDMLDFSRIEAGRRSPEAAAAPAKMALAPAADDLARLAGTRGAPLDEARAFTPPPLRGIDWERALAVAGGRPARLQHRIEGFAREYASAPARLRAALADGDDAALADLAHNLKSGAAYIGAEPLSAAAAALELELRGGRRGHLALLVPELSASLEDILAGLARIAPAPHMPGRAAGAGAAADRLATLAAQLDGYLAADDARAEDALGALGAALHEARLGAQTAAALALLQRAVREVEYETARAQLAVLARSIEADMEARA